MARGSVSSVLVGEFEMFFIRREKQVRIAASVERLPLGDRLNPEPESVFVITTDELNSKPLIAYRRRHHRKGKR